MNKWMLTGVVCAGLMTGCGGNVKRLNCSGLDWGKLGYESAQTGESVRQFDQYRDSCGDRLEAGALQTYIDGYTKGIIEHCTYKNGYTLGFTKRSMSKACPAELRSEYERGYRSGRIDLDMQVRDMKRMSEDKEQWNNVERSSPSTESK
jgi:hypothetical protein